MLQTRGHKMSMPSQILRTILLAHVLVFECVLFQLDHIYRIYTLFLYLLVEHLKTDVQLSV